MELNGWNNWELIEGVKRLAGSGEYVVYAKRAGWMFFHAIDARLIAAALFGGEVA